MRYESQRIACRLAVVAFAVLPTLLITGWIALEAAARFSLAGSAEWQRTLSDRTGLIVTVGQVHYPSPHLARLLDVQLADPRTGQPIGRADAVEVAAARHGWSVELVQPALESSQLGRLLAALQDQALRSFAADGDEAAIRVIRVTTDHLLVRGAAESVSLSEWMAEFQASSEAATFKAAFQWAGDRQPRPMRLVATRRQNEPGSQTEWLFDTADSTVPCALLAPLWPSLARLGAECSFSGEAQALLAPSGMSGTLRGRLQHVDLDALVSEQFPHRLSGLAEVTLDPATLADGRLAELRGVLRASAGTASASLLAAAAEHLQLAPAPETATLSPGAAVAFDRLAVRFDLAGESLALTSSEEAPTAGTLVSSAGRPLLAAPAGHMVPVVQLVRTLVPDSRYQVPATRQTAALVGWLPAPAVQPAAPPRAAAAHHPVRLAPAEPRTSSPAIRQPVLR